jgi:carbamoyl-phosphate synthase large subunit
MIAELERQTRAMALALNVGGLMNVQYRASRTASSTCSRSIPRASRTVPFVAKTIGVPFAKIAARIMAGESLASFGLTKKTLDHVAVKEAVFPFARFPGVDTILGPEMRSTGEVMGLARDFAMAFAKSQIGAARRCRPRAPCSSRCATATRRAIVCRPPRSTKLGFRIIATSGTQRYLAENGVPCAKINKVLEGRPHIVDAIKNGGVQLVINTTEGAQALADRADRL